MQGFAIKNSSKKNLIPFGDKIILDLLKNRIIAKYCTFGKNIFLESFHKINKSIISKYDMYMAIMSSEKEENIFQSIKKLIENIDEPTNFAVNVQRKGDQKYSSIELARNVAGAAFEIWPEIKVNLEKPQLEINIEIINNRSIIYLRN
jgi:adenylyl- and sulfurtransferase ThiI